MTSKQLLLSLMGGVGALALAGLVGGGVYAARSASTPSASHRLPEQLEESRTVREAQRRQLDLVRKIGALDGEITDLQKQIDASEVGSAAWKARLMGEWSKIKGALPPNLALQDDVNLGVPPQQDPVWKQISDELKSVDPGKIMEVKSALAYLKKLSAEGSPALADGLEGAEAKAVRDRHDQFVKELESARERVAGVFTQLSGQLRFKPGESRVGPYGINFLWLGPKNPAPGEGFWVASGELTTAQYAKEGGAAGAPSQMFNGPGALQKYTEDLNKDWEAYLPAGGYKFTLPDSAQWNAIDAASTGAHKDTLEKVQSGAAEYLADGRVVGPSDWTNQHDAATGGKHGLSAKAKRIQSSTARRAAMKYTKTGAKNVPIGGTEQRIVNGRLTYVPRTKRIPADIPEENAHTFAGRIVLAP